MDEIQNRLKATGISIEEDRAVPSNGITKPLPYMVIRSETEISGDDMGRLQVETTEWTAALFTSRKDPELERKIKLALAGLGRIHVTSFPDGVPYQTNFELKTKKILK